MPELPGVEHRFVDVDGLRMHVALAGEGDPIVLLHGWPQHWWQWRHLIPQLAEHHRVICPDLRGLGWTDAPRNGYRPSVQADDVLGLLDHLGVQRFGLIGHDWGGAAGYLIALRHPERVSRLLVLNTASPFLGPSPGVLCNGPHLWHILANTTPILAASAIPNWALRHWIHRGDMLSAEDRAIFLAQFREPARVRATVRYYRNLLAREIPLTLAGQFRWARLTVPTLIMAGDRDPLFPPEQMSDLGRYARTVRTELLDDVGHLPATEVPVRVGRRAVEWFTH